MAHLRKFAWSNAQDPLCRLFCITHDQSGIVPFQPVADFDIGQGNRDRAMCNRFVDTIGEKPFAVEAFLEPVNAPSKIALAIKLRQIIVGVGSGEGDAFAASRLGFEVRQFGWRGFARDQDLNPAFRSRDQLR
ncbi:hypothetical protein AUC45_06355 [Erythrobacter sp. YT30]|nr:hypothetical protein AUC45_06355 [Erythrobacter sp. YT30]